MIEMRLDPWDPLSVDTDPGMLHAAQRREIRNILRSYTGYYDLFSELIQNSLDAVEKRIAENSTGYVPRIWISINMKERYVAVTDNGCGMPEAEFKQFLRPNLSFKSGKASRGNKGVGATYLAYGFNQIEVATKFDHKILSGVLKRGREWVDDSTETVPRPKVEAANPQHLPFQSVDRGTSMVVRLIGSEIRPKDLTWLGADNAEKWIAVLRITTPLGGVYICNTHSKKVEMSIEVVDVNGVRSETTISSPRYLHPEEVFKRTADLRMYLADQERRAKNGGDLSRIPAKFTGLYGLWGEWSGDQLLNGESPVKLRLELQDRKLITELGISVRAFLAYSTELWDSYSDATLGLRKGQRVLRGGLQLATRNMPQGQSITIPMTNNIGFQNLAHILIHLENAEPDLGRKGFQPDVVRIAEKIAVSVVTAFRRHYRLLRKPGGAKAYDDELRLDEWKRKQLEHESKFPLIITGKGLFLPTEELAIRSEPLVEQDVVSLFNQMLTSGIVRGIHLISSSQFKQYDGLYRISMQPPFDRFILSATNPLGVDAEHFIERLKLESVVKILEYKYCIDGLIEELQSEVKATEDVDLVIAWELGKKWSEMFDIVSYLDDENVHLRTVHGLTHSFTHSMTGARAFEAIILRDLVSYLSDPASEQARQREQLSSDND